MASSSAAIRGLSGICVVVVVLAASDIEAALAARRSLARDRADLKLGFLLIEHARRRAPRFSADDLVSLDGESLHRAEFLRGVALASGRLVAPEVPDTPFGVESDTLAPHDLEGDPRR